VPRPATPQCSEQNPSSDSARSNHRKVSGRKRLRARNTQKVTSPRSRASPATAVTALVVFREVIRCSKEARDRLESCTRIAPVSSREDAEERHLEGD
jgi:hypothetical protein